MDKKIVVAVSGGFDPLHLGHLDHIKKAKALGDWLIAMVNPDEDMVRKKGYCFMPLRERVEMVRALRYVDDVIVVIDKDGTVAKTLEAVKPNIFAKGGDRTPENMPQNEIEACRKVGCKIVYGVGEKLNSSSKLVRRMVELHRASSA